MHVLQGIVFIVRSDVYYLFSCLLKFFFFNLYIEYE